MRDDLVQRLGFDNSFGFNRHHCFGGFCIVRCQPPDTEGIAIHLDGRAVERNRLFNGGGTDGHVTELYGIAQHEHVRCNAVAE